MSAGVTAFQMKAAWVRDPAVPAGQPAQGTYRCPGRGCGATIGPVDFGVPPEPCGRCGTQLDGRGWIVAPGQRELMMPVLVPGKTGPAFQEGG